MALTVALPSCDWFTPIDQPLSTAGLCPQARATASNSAVSIPQISLTRCGVQACNSSL